MASLNEKYEEKQKIISDQISVLQMKLKKHQSEQKQNPRNWANLGDLEFVHEKLGQINEFLQ